jgi:hypothetical protein
VMKVLYPEVDVLLLFDDSCGHDRQWEDGLNVENMLKGYGGKQSKLCHSLIKKVDGYLGPFNPETEWRECTKDGVLFNRWWSVLDGHSGKVSKVKRCCNIKQTD